MSYFKLKIFSKSAESLKQFRTHLFHREDLSKNFSPTIKFYKHQSRQSKFALLIAPHVYKTAQEHFKIDTFQSQYVVKTTNYIKFLKTLKKLKTEKFSDIRVVITLVHNTLQGNQSSVVCFENFFLQVLRARKKKKFVVKKRSRKKK